MTRTIATGIAAALLGLTTICAQAQMPTDARPLPDSHSELTPTDPAAVPTRAEHRTKAGLYTTEAQARQLETTLAGDVIAARVGCCGEQVVSADVRRIWDSAVVYEASASTPLLIRGDDLQHAALVVDGLTEQGLTHVFLVNPEAIGSGRAQ